MQVVSSTGSTTLSAAITTTGQTAISVIAPNLAVGVVIQVDSELMQITAMTGLNLTVTRGFNGTSAATHANNATVTIMAGVYVGPLLNSSTAMPSTSLAMTYAQIRVDGTVLGGGTTAFTTDSWGTATLFISLAAGQHRVEVQTGTTLPWCEPCLYVGPVGRRPWQTRDWPCRFPATLRRRTAARRSPQTCPRPSAPPRSSARS